MVGGNEDGDAFARWYRIHHPRLVASLLVICGDVSLASEAADEAFVRVLVRWRRVREMDSPVGWATVVARNALRELQRRERRRRSSELLASSTAVLVSPSPEAGVAVYDAVSRLPRRQREVVALHYLSGLTEAEVARVLHIAPGNVARTLHDARSALRVALTNLGDGRDSDE